MTAPTYDNWDRTIKPGDVVMAYTKGYHIVLSVDPRPNSSPMVHTRRVLDGNGNKARVSKKADKCDINWCRKITPEIIEQEAAQRSANFKELFDLAAKKL